MNKHWLVCVGVLLFSVSGYAAQISTAPNSVGGGNSVFKIQADSLTNDDALKGLKDNPVTPKDAVDVQLSAERGLTDSLQAGASLKLQATPSADVLNFIVNTQYAVTSFTSLRLDAGLRRSKCGTIVGSGHADVQTYNGFLGGVGLPTKISIGRWFALTSGRTAADGYGDDIVALDNNDCQTVYIIGAPVGALVSLGDSLNFGLRTGFKTLIGGDALGTSFVPFALDATYALNNRVDLGATAEWPGVLDQPGFTDRHVNYLFERKVSAWTQVRF